MEAIDPLERLHEAVGVGWGRAGSTASTEGLALGPLGFFDIKLQGLVMLQYHTISGWCHVVLYVKLYAGIFIDIQCQCMIVDVLRFVTILLPFKSGIPGTEGVSLVSLLCFCCMSFSLILLTVRLRTFLQYRNVGMSECRNVNVKNWWTFGMPWRSVYRVSLYARNARRTRPLKKNLLKRRQISRAELTFAALWYMMYMMKMQDVNTWCKCW